MWRKNKIAAYVSPYLGMNPQGPQLLLVAILLLPLLAVAGPSPGRVRSDLSSSANTTMQVGCSRIAVVNQSITHLIYRARNGTTADQTLASLVSARGRTLHILCSNTNSTYTPVISSDAVNLRTFSPEAQVPSETSVCSSTWAKTCVFAVRHSSSSNSSSPQTLEVLPLPERLRRLDERGTCDNSSGPCNTTLNVSAAESSCNCSAAELALRHECRDICNRTDRVPLCNMNESVPRFNNSCKCPPDMLYNGSHCVAISRDNCSALCESCAAEPPYRCVVCRSAAHISARPATGLFVDCRCELESTFNGSDCVGTEDNATEKHYKRKKRSHGNSAAAVILLLCVVALTGVVWVCYGRSTSAAQLRQDETDLQRAGTDNSEVQLQRVEVIERSRPTIERSPSTIERPCSSEDELAESEQRKQQPRVLVV